MHPPADIVILLIALSPLFPSLLTPILAGSAVTPCRILAPSSRQAAALGDSLQPSCCQQKVGRAVGQLPAALLRLLLLLLLRLLLPGCLQ
jgi:hypothetical protein